MQNPFFSLSEARRFVALGLPVFVAQMSQMGMNFVDTAMTGQASTADMAAVAVAGSIWNPLSLLGIGCLLSLPAMSAHLVGGGQRPRTPHLLRQGIWLTLGISAILMTVFYVISWHLQSFGLDEELSRLGGGYLRAMLWGLPGFMLFVNVRSFLEGYARTRPAMIIGILGLALNVPCNYVLIYGKLGLPRLGAVGCGVATALCYWFMAVCMIYYVRRDAQYRDLHPLFLPLLLPRTARSCGCEARARDDASPLAAPYTPEPVPCRFDVPLIWRILRIGLPGALAVFFEVSLFAVTALLLAPLGKVVVAGHQIAMNFAGLVFMLPLSLNITAAIRVGQSVGAGRLGRARLSARTALCMGAASSLVIAACTALFREQIVHIYNDDPAVTALATGLLLLGSCYQLVDALQTISIGILRTYNDTRTISLVCFASYWVIGLPLGFTLARTDLVVPALGAAGFWIAYIAALGFGALCYLARVHHLHGLDAGAVRRRIQR